MTARLPETTLDTRREEQPKLLTRLLQCLLLPHVFWKQLRAARCLLTGQNVPLPGKGRFP